MAPSDLLPGETVVHEVFPPPAPRLLTLLGWAGVVFGLFLMLGSAVFPGVALAAIGGGLIYQARKAKPRVRRPSTRITNRRVIAYKVDGADEIQLAKIETVQTKGRRVILRGSGGSEFAFDAPEADQARNAIQRAIADHVK
jgi:hypothetical protein